MNPRDKRYSAKRVDGDEYLLRLTRCIHLNPVHARDLSRATSAARREELEGYRWSRYRSHVGLEPPREFVHYRWLKLMGRVTLRGNQSAYRRYIEGFNGREPLAKQGFASGVFRCQVSGVRNDQGSPQHVAHS